MDPLSLTFGITSLLQTIAMTTSAVADLVKIYRSARGDLLQVNGELLTLKQILEWLKNDTEDTNFSSIPDPLTSQITSIISHCNGTLDKIKLVIQKHSGPLGPARWAIDGKKDVANLQGELTAYRAALNLTLETLSIFLAKDIKADTASIRDDTTTLKLGQEQILAKIEELQVQLPQTVRDKSPILRRYLDSLASYAGSTCDETNNWEEYQHLEESSESGLEKDSIATKGKMTAVTAKADSSSGNDRRSSSLSCGERASPAVCLQQSLAASLEDEDHTQPENSSGLQTENSSSLSLHTCYQESRATDGCPVETPETLYLEQQLTFNFEETGAMDLMSTEQFAADKSQAINEGQVVSTPFEGNSQRLDPEVPQNAAARQPGSITESVNSGDNTGHTATLQPTTTTESMDSRASKRNIRSAVPLPSGNWALGKTIHAGKRGMVRIVKNRVTGAATGQAVCKIIPRPRSSDENPLIQETRIAREAASIFLLDHPFICGHIDIGQTNNNWYLILQYVDSGTLLQYLVAHRRLKEKQAQKFSRQILSALDYCHRHNIVHRDLRLENILLTSQGDVKLKGFVRSNIFSPNGHLMTSGRYLYYTAPEVLKGHAYVGPKLDVWSFGVVLYHLVCGKVPFDAESLPKLVAKISRGKVDNNGDLTDACNKLLSRTLQPDPRNRAALKEVINHPWIIKGYDSPPSNVMSSREPLGHALDDEIISMISRMTAFNLGSPEEIKEHLTQIIESEDYHHTVARQQSEEEFTPEPQLLRETPIKRIFSAYKRHKPSISTTELDSFTNRNPELSPQDDPLTVFDPMIYLYYLARDKHNKG